MSWAIFSVFWSGIKDLFWALPFVKRIWNSRRGIRRVWARPYRRSSRPERLRLFGRGRRIICPNRVFWRLDLHEFPQMPVVSPAALERYRKELGQIDELTIFIEDDPGGPMYRGQVPGMLLDKDDVKNTSLSAEFDVFMQRVARAGLGYITTPSRMYNDDHSLKVFLTAVAGVLDAASRIGGKRLRFVLRTDSCLRSSFKHEHAGVSQAFSRHNRNAPDLLIFCPAYIEQGRYTIDGAHFIESKDSTQPVHQSEYARFSGFEYHSSDLAEWLEEKTRGQIKAGKVELVSLRRLHETEPEVIAEQLSRLPAGTTVVFDSWGESDPILVAKVCQVLERQYHKELLYRAGPSLAYALIGKSPARGGDRDEVNFLKSHCSTTRRQGIMVAGSLTKVSKSQIQTARKAEELDLQPLLFHLDEVTEHALIENLPLWAAKVRNALSAGRSVLITTDRSERQEIQYPDSTVRNQVLSAFSMLLRAIPDQFGWILFKGSDTANHALKHACKARHFDYLGPLFPGAGLLRVTDAKAEKRWSDKPLVFFAGNVGTDRDLLDVCLKLQQACGGADPGTASSFAEPIAVPSNGAAGTTQELVASSSLNQLGGAAAPLESSTPNEDNPTAC